MKNSAFLLALAATVAASPALAGAYRIELAVPPGGKLLHGHGGLEAADERTATALVRLIAPGNDIHERGTVRVLVMNLGATAFEFGPDQVTLSFADGTVLREVPVAQMEDGRELVERETRYAMSNDLRNRNNLSGLAQQANSGMTVQSLSPRAAAPGSTLSGTAGHDYRTEDSLIPGVQLLDSIYQVLIPLNVPPQKAWGGYYVFDVPKAVFRKRTDQPLTITVRTGAEEHRFSAVMKWK